MLLGLRNHSMVERINITSLGYRKHNKPDTRSAENYRYNMSYGRVAGSQRTSERITVSSSAAGLSGEAGIVEPRFGIGYCWARVVAVRAAVKRFDKKDGYLIAMLWV